MQHIMLDLETFGTKPGCALRSVGAVAFELDGQIGPQFYLNIDKQSCLDAGLTIDPDTLAWWERQSEEAQASLLVDPHPLAGVVAGFHGWFKEQRGLFVWSHGGNFDEPIWGAACNAVGERRPPWKFWNARCTRTLYHLANFDPRSIPREGTYHNSLDDARYQARCVIAALRRFGTSPDTASGPITTGDQSPAGAAP